MKKRVLSLFCVLLAVMLLLCSCGGIQPKLFSLPGEALSRFFSNSSHLLSGNTPILLDGVPRYSLENNATGSAAASANSMLSALEQACGTPLGENESAKRFRIGLGLMPELSASEFYIGFFENDFLITAQSEPMLASALEHFEQTYVQNGGKNIGNGFLFVDSKLAYRSPTLSLSDADGEPLYALCYPDGANNSVMEALSTVRSAIRAASGIQLSLYSDLTTEEEPGESLEILIGNTSREASVAAASKISYDSYYIGIEGNKIVITAQNDFMLQKAANAFVSLFINHESAAVSYEETKLLLPADFSVTHTEQILELVKDGKTDYTLIYPASIDALSFSYVKDFLFSFRSLTGVSLPAYSDAEIPFSSLEGGSKEIQIGHTNRPGAVPTAGAGVLLCSGSDIKVLSDDGNNLRLSLQALYNMIETAAKAQNPSQETVWRPIYSTVFLDIFTEIVFTNAPDIPQFTDVIDIGDSAYMLYKNNAVDNDFDAYLNTLNSLNYTLHDRGTSATVRYATFYSDDEILNVTFTSADNILRVTVDPRNEAALQPLAATPHNGKTDVTPLFVQLGGMNDFYLSVDCGMSYITRLTDGTFIVVDGGYSNAENVEELYNTLKELNVLGGKPIISAWIFSHAHSDHIAGFRAFTDKYARSVTLKSVIYSFPTAEQAAVHGGSWVVEAQSTFRNYIAEYGKDVTVYKARTGQQYAFADCEIEMLFTFEDYAQPKTLSYFNDSSIVFSMTLSDNGKNAQKFMMLGDCSEASAAILVARYGDYLKSDVVQVAHHGYAGGTDALYDAIQAAVVFWPCPLYDPRDGVNVDKRFNNPKWSKVTRVMLGKDYAVALYVAGLGDATLTLTQIKNREIIGIGMVAADAKYPS